MNPRNCDRLSLKDPMLNAEEDLTTNRREKKLTTIEAHMVQQFGFFAYFNCYFPVFDKK